MKRIFYRDHTSCFGDLYKPSKTISTKSKAWPIAILIHGGYWKDNHDLNSYMTHKLIDPLLDLGMAVWNLEYQRMEFEPQKPTQNTQAPWPTILNDVAEGIDFLNEIAEEENLDLQRILGIGHSAGGHLITWAASRKNIPSKSEVFRQTPLQIHRVISIAGILNFNDLDSLNQPVQIERFLNGDPKEFTDRKIASDPFSLRNINMPLVIVHGAKDYSVFIRQAESYVNDSLNAQLNYVTMPEADHFAMLDETRPEWDILQGLIKEEVRNLREVIF